MLVVFYALAGVLIAIAGALAGAGVFFKLGLAAFSLHLGWQIVRLNIDDPALCLRLFKSNRDAGLILFGGMLLDATF
jgi:4-hydroxybenzoate polyprenyltransferase